MKVTLLAAISAAAILLIPIAAQATLLGFYNITANNVADATIGETQLSVDVLDYGSNQVLFWFSNAGPDASSITDIYFDDGSLLGIAGLIDADDGVGGHSGVDFSQNAAPPNLPGANNATPPFVTTTGFLADSDPPTQPNGVNPGEYLGIYFSLQGGRSFSNVLDDLSSGALRVGIHVQGFDSGGSESFINEPNGGTEPIPEPGTILLLGSGLVGLAGFGRIRFRCKSK